MSSRPPTAMPTTAYRQDDERRRDEARIVTLQNQIDELRQGMRELLSRQARGEEQFKLSEGTGAQNRIALDQFRQEFLQLTQARALDENRTRQQLTDLEARLEDATRPIRSLQAHVAELIELSRKKTDDSGQFQKRFDDLRGAIEHVAAHSDRTLVVTHQLRDSLDQARTETDGLRRDILRAEDAVKIVDVDARRRIAEVSQSGENVGARIDELRSDLSHLADLIDETRRSIVHIDPALEDLRGIDVGLRQDLLRIQLQANERHENTLERAEDVRQETDDRFTEIGRAIDQRAERLVERIEAANEDHRDLAYRLSTFSGQLDELRQIDASLRRDIWYLHEHRVRLRLEQAQQEMDIVMSQRRESEATHGSASGSGSGSGSAPEPRARRRPVSDDGDL